MSAKEARQCINKIKAHINSVRVLLLNLDERGGDQGHGWKTKKKKIISAFSDHPYGLTQSLTRPETLLQLNPKHP